jgi:hypothetical protein
MSFARSLQKSDGKQKEPSKDNSKDKLANFIFF